jgi:hypothetical protein
VPEVAISPDPPTPPLDAPALPPALVVPPVAFPPLPPILVVPPAPTVPPELWLPPKPLLPPKAPPLPVGPSDSTAPSVESTLTDLPQPLPEREMALAAKTKDRNSEIWRMERGSTKLAKWLTRNDKGDFRLSRRLARLPVSRLQAVGDLLVEWATL